jgi:hypothetical protein
MPGKLPRADRLTVAPILRDSRTGPDPLRIQPERLVVHPIRFGEHQGVLIDAELICQPEVCKVPRIGLPARRDSEVRHIGDKPLWGRIGSEAAARKWAVEDRTQICVRDCCSQRR